MPANSKAGESVEEGWLGEAPNGPKRTIQAAMSIAQTGDEVIIADGVYRGTGNKFLSFPGTSGAPRSSAPASSCARM